MEYRGIERRRSPRVTPAVAHRVSLRGSFTVRLLDFSDAGVLLASKIEMNEGDRAEMRATTAADAAEAVVPVEIRHVSPQVLPRVGPRFCAGAVITDPSPVQRARLGAVLRAERT